MRREKDGGETGSRRDGWMHTWKRDSHVTKTRRPSPSSFGQRAPPAYPSFRPLLLGPGALDEQSRAVKVGRLTLALLNVALLSSGVADAEGWVVDLGDDGGSEDDGGEGELHCWGVEVEDQRMLRVKEV